MAGGYPLQAGQGVFHHIGHGAVRLPGKRTLHQHARRPTGEGVFHEVIAIHMLAGKGNEQVAGQRLA